MPPSRWIPCTAVSRMKNAYAGLAGEYSPDAASCRHAQSCPPRNANEKAPLAMRPVRMPSRLPRRAAVRVICMATLANTRSALLIHSTRGSGKFVQSASTIRM